MALGIFVVYPNPKARGSEYEGHTEGKGKRY